MVSFRERKSLILLGILLAVLAAFLIFIQDRYQPTADEIGTVLKPRNIRPDTKSALDEDRFAPPGVIAATDSKVTTLIQASLTVFSEGLEPEDAWTRLRSLREGIRSAPEAEAAAAILTFLKSNVDTPTGLPFTIGPEGMMDAVPTLRIALLDLLPSLDPRTALQMAREIMALRTTPDEYALSLRNMAWNDLNGDLRNELSARFLDLMKMPWLDQPSAGFLESFDIAVEIGGKTMFDQMVSIARDAEAKSNTTACQAAYMSMDRMIIRDPSLLTASFTGNANWMSFAPQQRASLLSRLNIADTAQREVFERYLTSFHHAKGELEYFSNIFPNGNFLYGNRLVTTAEKTPSIADIATTDKQVLEELAKMNASGGAAVAIQAIRDHLKDTAASP